MKVWNRNAVINWIWPCLMVVVLATGRVDAEEQHASTGYAKGAAPYLSIPLHPSLASLAGTGVAWREQLAGLQVNPAILDGADSSGATLLGSYSLMTQDRKYGGVDLVMGLGPYLVFDLSVVNHSVEDIPQTSEFGVTTGTFAYRQSAAAMTVAGRLLWNAAAGMRIRYLFENALDYRANGVGFDLGGTWEPLPILRLGASVQNILSYLWASTGTVDNVLMVGKAGAAGLLLDGKLQMEVDVSKSIGVPWDVACGAQYAFDELLFFRGGVTTSIDSYSYTVRKPDYALGLGMRYAHYGFDYAFVLPSSGLGATHKIGVMGIIPVD